jgi:hypothetical protein
VSSQPLSQSIIVVGIKQAKRRILNTFTHVLSPLLSQSIIVVGIKQAKQRILNTLTHMFPPLSQYIIFIQSEKDSYDVVSLVDASLRIRVSRQRSRRNHMTTPRIVTDNNNKINSANNNANVDNN